MLRSLWLQPLLDPLHLLGRDRHVEVEELVERPDPLLRQRIQVPEQSYGLRRVPRTSVRIRLYS
jgi:hypothetical protein